MKRTLLMIRANGGDEISLEKDTSAVSVLKDDFDVDVLGYLDTHELPECALVCVNVDEPLVDPHFPVFPRSSAFAAGALPRWDYEPAGR